MSLNVKNQRVFALVPVSMLIVVILFQEKGVNSLGLTLYDSLAFM